MIKSFQEFNESMYSVAARMVPQYTKPTQGNYWNVNQVIITFKDGTTLPFRISREDFYSQTLNYVLKQPEDRNSLQSLYISIYGNAIQMENYQEFVFVRCWNNEADFEENDWSGFIYRQDLDRGFHEIDMKFKINSEEIISYKNKYCSQWVMREILQQYIIDFPKGIEYKEVISYKRKLQSWLLNIDETKTFNLIQEKIEGKSIISILYSIQLKDEETIKRLSPLTEQKLVSCKSKDLLDTLFID